MGKDFSRIDESLREFIGDQAMFFVATAPSGGGGHVNASPKGPIGTLRVLDERTVAYLDLVGSGAETIAHLRDNGRIVLMFCAFAGPPRILRLHGRGEDFLDGCIELPLERAGGIRCGRLELQEERRCLMERDAVGELVDRERFEVSVDVELFLPGREWVFGFETSARELLEGH